MKHRSLRPSNRLWEDDGKTPRPVKPAVSVRRPRLDGSPVSPTLLGQTDPGPRPLTERQRELRTNRLTGQDVIDRAVPPRTAKPAPSARSWREDGKRRHIRDADTTHLRRPKSARPVASAAKNRLRVNPLPLLLRGAVVLLVVECFATVLWSPRFFVTKTRVEGNSTVSTNRLMADLAVPAHRSLAVLPVGTMRARVLQNEPPIETAEVHRSLPGTVRLVVRERTPWASVCLPTGDCYTIDKNLVPFRRATVPEKGLPRLLLAPAEEADMASSTTVLPAVTLGKPLKTPGLAEVSKCLNWATAHSFPLDSVRIAANGELCLNRTGDVQVKLGTPTDLDKKLRALSVLLEQKPTLRESTDIAYVNLYAFDAPAILPRSAVPPVPTATAEDSAANQLP